MFFLSLSRIIPCITKRSHRRSSSKTARASRPRPHDAPQRTDLRLGRIVRLLMENATVVVSGTKIADEIGTGRSEVWRLVQQLRTLGVEIAGHPATGYQLKTVPDLLLPDMLAPALKGTIFGADVHRNFHHYFKIGSTNIEAMESAAAGAAEGSVFVAEEQTAGRGRGAHQWESAASAGIYCSVVLRPALPPSEALVLSLAAGLAVQSAVRADRLRSLARSEVAQRSADRGQEVLRHSD